MLTNTFKILVNNLFKKKFRWKIKKIIRVFGICGLKIENICRKNMYEKMCEKSYNVV